MFRYFLLYLYSYCKHPAPQCFSSGWMPPSLLGQLLCIPPGSRSICRLYVFVFVCEYCFGICVCICICICVFNSFLSIFCTWPISMPIFWQLSQGVHEDSDHKMLTMISPRTLYIPTLLVVHLQCIAMKAILSLTKKITLAL